MPIRFRYGALTACGLSFFLVFGCGKPPVPTTLPATTQAAATFPFQDPNLPLDKRVDDLVGRMTLEEKASQLVQDAPAIERLGVPAYHWWNEALHGVARNGVATVFPQAIGLAATWNTDLHHEVATTISVEGRAKHEQALQDGIRRINTGLDFWSPNVNIFRDPRWGRGQETYGEDPYLTGRFGVAFVRGIQGDDPKWFRAIATPKHFAVHSGPEVDRHHFDAQVSEIDLWTTYLPAFEACVREGHAYSVMAAYQRLDGVPCSANPRLLTDILRKQWGFDGYVVSDVDAVYDIYAGHQMAASPTAAAALAVKAGCDLNGGNTYSLLPGAVEAGLATIADIDRAVRRLMTARFRLGMFDPPGTVPYSTIAPDMNDVPAHDALAREAARQSIVLLKNAGNVLPLRKDLNTIAVIGPTADDYSVLVGNYHGTPARPVTLLQGIRNAVPARTRVLYTQGCPLVPELMALEETVPATCLFTDASRTVPGLSGNYFHNVGSVSWPLKVEVDRQIDFDWNTQAVRDGLNLGDTFTVSWSGILVPPESGQYQLGLAGHDGYRLWLNDQLLVDEWHQGPRRYSGTRVNLEKNKPCAIRVEYFHAGDFASIQLRWTRPDGEPPFAEALRLTQRADAVIMVLGITPELEREEEQTNFAGFQMGDRTSLDLPRVQEDLLEAVTAAGKPVILVLTSGSALSVNWAAAHVPAIVQTWYSGQHGGTALADVLFGDYNPAGRLPVTFYKSVADLPAFDDYKMDNRTYRYFTGEPLYPFGFGLSYTHFDYRDLSITSSVPAPDTTHDLTVRVKVRNAGERDGDEVVQLYLTHVGATIPAPLRALQGFKRIPLKAGEEKTVEFTLTPHQLALVTADAKRITYPGQIKIQAGPSSAQGLTQTLTLQGAATEPQYRYVEPRIK